MILSKVKSNKFIFKIEALYYILKIIKTQPTRYKSKYKNINVSLILNNLLKY